MKVRRARVAAALSGHAVIVKRLSLPAMSQAELSEAIPWEAEQYIPFDLSEVQLDYQVVNSGDPNKSGLDVLLVAAKRGSHRRSRRRRSPSRDAGRSCSTSKRSRSRTPIR